MTVKKDFMAFNENKTRSMLSEINITPMVDVMLVLLIIFMITAPLLQQGIDVDLPQVNSNTKQAAEPNDTVLTITKSGQIFINEDRSTSFNNVNIADKLAQIYKDRDKKEIYLRADQSVPYGHVAKLMGVCKNLGIERVGMVTEPESNIE